jgi:hypothetical protein
MRQHESRAVDDYAGADGDRGGGRRTAFSKVAEQLAHAPFDKWRRLRRCARDRNNARLSAGDRFDERLFDLESGGRTIWSCGARLLR